MNKNTFKKLCLLTGFSILIYYFFQSLLNAYYYKDFGGILSDFLINFNMIQILAIFLVVSGFILPDQKTVKRKKWILFFMIGCLPFIAVLIYGLISMVSGFTFINSSSYGLQAFVDSTVLFSYLFWPLYIIGLAFIILSVFKLKR